MDPLTNINDLLLSPLNNNGTNCTNNGQQQNSQQPVELISQYFCTKHENEVFQFYCRTCQVPVCKDCIIFDHPAELHKCEHIEDSSLKQIEILQCITELRNKISDLRNVLRISEENSDHIKMFYNKAQDAINETYQFFKSQLDERKEELLKKLQNIYDTQNVSNSVLIMKSEENIEKILQDCESVERVTNMIEVNETVMLKKLIDSKTQECNEMIQEFQLNPDLTFISNYQAIQAAVRNTFGYIRSSDMFAPTKQPPIARPTNRLSSNGSSSISPTYSTTSLNGIGNCNETLLNLFAPVGNGTSLLDRDQYRSIGNSSTLSIDNEISNGGSQSSNLHFSSCLTDTTGFDSNILSEIFNSVNSLGSTIRHVNPPDKWSNNGSGIFNGLSDKYSIGLNSCTQNGMSLGGVGGNHCINNDILGSANTFNVTNSTLSTDSIMNSTSKLLPTTVTSPIKRGRIRYNRRFGEFGIFEGQFAEPSGVAVNAQDDIVVADANNHRIQIFDKYGLFKFQFGECGKRDGQLLYPNRVAIVKSSGDFVITERAPTHQIQIYNQYGQFKRKFGANILLYPRGVTVDNKGLIIIVECKIMRIVIFDQFGNVLQKFSCERQLEFPNCIVVNDKQEIFVSDNRLHCVKIFNYKGEYLREIGGNGLTKFPIAVCINSAGEIIIADNHNNFNLTIFTQDGQLISPLESCIKHAQCFDVALMNDGSVIVSSKDYRLYIYKYVEVPSNAF